MASAPLKSRDGDLCEPVVPSRGLLGADNTRCTLTQNTRVSSRLNRRSLRIFLLASPKRFYRVRRIPEWMGARRSVAVQRAARDAAIEPGKLLGPAAGLAKKNGNCVVFARRILLYSVSTCNRVLFCAKRPATDKQVSINPVPAFVVGAECMNPLF